MKTIKDYNKYITGIRAFNKGMGVVFRFDNGYGLSVVCHSYSYGTNEELFEIAVLKFTSDDNWRLCYDTPITGYVLGHQSDEDLIDVIEKAIAL